MASPQKAMAKSGAISWALWKCAAASSYSKLWSCANPWRKSACAACGPEFANATSPKSCWAKAGAQLTKNMQDSRQNKEEALFMDAPLSEGDLAEGRIFSLTLTLAHSTPVAVARQRIRIIGSVSFPLTAFIRNVDYFRFARHPPAIRTESRSPARECLLGSNLNHSRPASRISRGHSSTWC